MPFVPYICTVYHAVMTQQRAQSPGFPSILCVNFFFYSFIYLKSYAFLYFSNSTFLSLFLPFLFLPYSLLLSHLYFFLLFHLPSLIFLGLYIFFHLFLCGSLLSLIPESLYPVIIYLFIHHSFFLPFNLQSFLRTFSLSYLFPFCLSLVPTFILCRLNLRQLLFEYEGTVSCLQECFRVHVSSLITEKFLKLIMPVSCCVHSHSIFFQRSTKC